MDRRKIGEVLWYALQCAKHDRETFVDAYRGDTSVSVVKEALADIRAFERLQVRVFGTSRSQHEEAISRMRSVDLIDLLAKNVNLEEYIDRAGS